jgi:dihydrofolate reductase
MGEMQKPLLRYYVAASVDGFIATPDGGVDWLAPFQEAEVGFEAFMRGIGTVAMGRTTYDQVIGFGGPWPYAGKRAVVLTSRPLGDAPPGVEARAGGAADLAQDLRAGTQAGDVWLVGGARAVRPFLDLGLVDRIELTVVPVLLGDGLPLFERSARAPQALRLEEVRPLPLGMVQVLYARGPDRAG